MKLIPGIFSNFICFLFINEFENGNLPKSMFERFFELLKTKDLSALFLIKYIISTSQILNCFNTFNLND